MIHVDVFGQIGRLDEIYKICKEYDIYCIEDAAESFGSKLNNSNIDSEEVYIKIKKYVQNNSSDNPKYRWIKDIGHNEGVFVFSAKN